MGFGPVLDDHFPALSLDGDILVHLHIGRHPQHKSYDKADTNLSDDFVFAFQSLLIAAEYLDIIVHSTKEPQPNSGDDHQYQIDVTQSS